MMKLVVLAELGKTIGAEVAYIQHELTGEVDEDETQQQQQQLSKGLKLINQKQDKEQCEIKTQYYLKQHQ